MFSEVHGAISQQMACGQSVQPLRARELRQFRFEVCVRVHALNFEPRSISFLALP